MEFTRLQRDGFIELGAEGFGLTTRDSRTDRLQALAGARAYRGWETSAIGTVSLQAYAEWQRTLDGRGLEVDASFVGVDSWAPLALAERSSTHLGVALELSPWRKAMLSFGYDLRNGSDERNDRQWSSRLRVGF